MTTFQRMSQTAVAAVAAFALLLTGCDALFDDQITPYDGPDFVEFGQDCPTVPTTPCYEKHVTDAAGVVELPTNLIGPQRTSDTEMRFRVVDVVHELDEDGNVVLDDDGDPVVMYETTAVADVHYTLPQGTTYTLPANSSFGFIQVETVEGSVPSGHVLLVLELEGSTDGTIGAAGPGPERPRQHHMKYFTVRISPS